MINNAGITKDNLSSRMKEEEWKNVKDIKQTTRIELSKCVVKKMLKNKKGKIINITSVVGHTGNIGQANYTASKAGLVAMSKSFALEYGKKNINVNCVSPGFIATEMTNKIDENYRIEKNVFISSLIEWKIKKTSKNGKNTEKLFFQGF